MELTLENSNSKLQTFGETTWRHYDLRAALVDIATKGNDDDNNKSSRPQVALETFVVNLDRRPDRWQKTQEWLQPAAQYTYQQIVHAALEDAFMYTALKTATESKYHLLDILSGEVASFLFRQPFGFVDQALLPRLVEIMGATAQTRFLRVRRWSATDGHATLQMHMHMQQGPRTHFDFLPPISASFEKTENLQEIKALRPGVAGCWKSHVRLWKHIASQSSLQKSGHWVLVLEDDAYPCTRWLEGLRSLLDVVVFGATKQGKEAKEKLSDDVGMIWLGFHVAQQVDRWNLNRIAVPIKLYERPRAVWLDNDVAGKQHVLQNVALQQDPASHLGGTHAYLLRASGAVELLRDLEQAHVQAEIKKRGLAIDEWLLRRRVANVRQWSVTVPLFFADFVTADTDIQIPNSQISPTPSPFASSPSSPSLTLSTPHVHPHPHQHTCTNPAHAHAHTHPHVCNNPAHRHTTTMSQPPPHATQTTQATQATQATQMQFPSQQIQQWQQFQQFQQFQNMQRSNW